MEKLIFDIELSATLGTESKDIQGYFYINDDLLGKYVFNESGTWKQSATLEVDESTHKIGFTLNNKSARDTVLDESKNIISDTLITLEKLQIDGIDVTELFLKNAVFEDQTGKQVAVTRNVGINGTYSMEFSVPYYEWLLSKV